MTLFSAARRLIWRAAPPPPSPCPTSGSAAFGAAPPRPALHPPATLARPAAAVSAPRPSAWAPQLGAYLSVYSNRPVMLPPSQEMATTGPAMGQP